MARLPRFSIPGIPQHVVQRGNNKGAVFFADVHYEFYLAVLRECAAREECDIHAYVLMTNHVHLLVTPRKPSGVSRLMQGVGRKYVSYVNYRCGRTGGLWEGRYRATLVDSEQYLLTCYRYIELNPVRAGIVDRPEQYRWSSYRRNALGVSDPVVTSHDLYLALGSDRRRQREAYRELFEQQINLETIESIRACTHKGWVLGGEEFGRIVEGRSGRTAFPRQPGRRPETSMKKGRD